MSDGKVTRLECAPHRLSQASAASPKILFLGYGVDRNVLIKALTGRGCEVWHGEKDVAISEDFDLVISFGYRTIIPKDVIRLLTTPIINLHISYLPFNRGAHPNYWSFIEGTPSGVSIHMIDEGIDTGPILYQKLVQFDRGEITFSQTYERLIDEVQALFLKNVDDILGKSYTLKAQIDKGTYHKISDLPKDFPGWGTRIDDEIRRIARKKGR